jgi:hypothetical protein
MSSIWKIGLLAVTYAAPFASNALAAYKPSPLPPPVITATNPFTEKRSVIEFDMLIVVQRKVPLVE